MTALRKFIDAYDQAVDTGTTLEKVFLREIETEIRTTEVLGEPGSSDSELSFLGLLHLTVFYHLCTVLPGMPEFTPSQDVDRDISSLVQFNHLNHLLSVKMDPQKLKDTIEVTHGRFSVSFKTFFNATNRFKAQKYLWEAAIADQNCNVDLYQLLLNNPTLDEFTNIFYLLVDCFDPVAPLETAPPCVTQHLLQPGLSEY